MSLLGDFVWKTKYTPEDGDLVERFYVPALECAVRYDRSTGYFSAAALAVAARGVEHLVLNRGRMRLVVGCTLGEPEIEAISKGESLRDTVEARLLKMPLAASEPSMVEALELLAWMVAKGYLEVKVAVPCDRSRRPVAGDALFHEKAGIVEDKTGDRIAFNGSINETAYGWKHNWDSFHVFASWEGTLRHVDAEEQSFQSLWANRSKRAVVLDVPGALKEELLRFMPRDGELPARLKNKEAARVETPEEQPGEVGSEAPEEDPRRVVWSFIKEAPSLPGGGERVGEATCAVVPWPHQVKAFHRMYDSWPPKLLIADEVGLGKTIQAGLVVRQAWLSGRARRILIMAPKAVLSQWQVELREKFNLNWPVYDGQKLTWYASPAYEGRGARPAGRDSWHEEPFVLASSHLMRRRDRASELLEAAEPWDLVVLDEAHHARRRGVGGADERPNQLLRLMRGLKGKTQGLVLLTATPMQVSPVEVWDLLSLLDPPSEWSEGAFTRFFEKAAKPAPSHGEMAFMASLFRSIEAAYGEVTTEEAGRFFPGAGKFKIKKILRALRDGAEIPLKQMEAPERKAAIRLMKANTPVKRLVSRHTRELLRSYYKAGKLSTRIADRQVEDRFVRMSEAEREVYEAMEHYISSTYNNTAREKRTAIGFVMTVYRRRLASSFHALGQTLEDRLGRLSKPASTRTSIQAGRLEEDVLEDELAAEAMDAEEAGELETEALALEERGDIESLLLKTRSLPPDTKTQALEDVIRGLRRDGYRQVMVFTQFTDTMDFLRDSIRGELEGAVLCFSGRGGEVEDGRGGWRRVSRDETKKRFMERKADVMLCTDAAAEGLNFQFCGALVNYDMPWNPMKVEQRIGRIDRLGQEHGRIRIVNLHYEDTVETDVYCALRERIDLFQTFVGRLQPILSGLPRAISRVALGDPRDRDRARADLAAEIADETGEVEEEGFDLDTVAEADLSEPPRPEPLYDLGHLGAILESEKLLPPGVEVKKVGGKDFSYIAPGMARAVRVTADPEYFDLHPESTELWSPGSPVFPEDEDGVRREGTGREAFLRALGRR